MFAEKVAKNTPTMEFAIWYCTNSSGGIPMLGNAMDKINKNTIPPPMPSNPASKPPSIPDKMRMIICNIFD